MRVLVLNCGSSSIKYELSDAQSWTVLASGALERIGSPEARLLRRGRGPSGRLEETAEPAAAADHRRGLARVLEALDASAEPRRAPDLAAVGHRVVHGGEAFGEPVLVDDRVMETLRSLVHLAPLHLPPSLAGIEVAREACPGVPQVAVFDTAFHRTLPAHAYTYALPLRLRAEGVRRYGFHGSSHRYVARRAAAFLGRPLEEVNLVTLHLGNGASATAVRGGRSVDTSMGMTPLEGLVMGTRCGDLDAAVPLHLARRGGLTPDELERLLNDEAGLLGLCGSRDVREVTARAEAGDPDAALAVDVYCQRVKKYVGAYLAVLGRVDAVVFTAGVGENSALVRRRSLDGLGALGISLDEARNGSPSREERAIHAEGSPVKVLVIPTHEELEIARAALACLESRGDAAGASRRTP